MCHFSNRLLCGSFVLEAGSLDSLEAARHPCVTPHTAVGGVFVTDEPRPLKEDVPANLPAESPALRIAALVPEEGRHDSPGESSGICPRSPKAASALVRARGASLPSPPGPAPQRAGGGRQDQRDSQARAALLTLVMARQRPLLGAPLGAVHGAASVSVLCLAAAPWPHFRMKPGSDPALCYHDS